MGFSCISLPTSRGHILHTHMSHPCYGRVLITLWFLRILTVPLQHIKGLFSSDHCPNFSTCEFAENDCWYITFDSEEDTQKVSFSLSFLLSLSFMPFSLLYTPSLPPNENANGNDANGTDTPFDMYCTCRNQNSLCSVSQAFAYLREEVRDFLGQPIRARIKGTSVQRPSVVSKKPPQYYPMQNVYNGQQPVSSVCVCV